MKGVWLCVLLLLSFGSGFLLFTAYKKVKKYTEPVSPRKEKVYVDYFIKDLPRKEVSFKTKDGIKISGWLFENNSNKAVLLIHGIAENRSFLNRLVRFFHKNGYTVLSIDLRNHGKSQKTKTTLGFKERLDVLAAGKFLRERGYKTVVALGVSMGAVSLALALDEKPELFDFAVLDSPYLSLKESTKYTYKNFPKALANLLTTVSIKLGELFTGIDSSKLEVRDIILKNKSKVAVIFCEIDRYLDTKEAYNFLKQQKVSTIFFENTEHALAFVWYPKVYEDFLTKVLSRY